MSRMPERYLHVPRAYYYSEDGADYSESEVDYPSPYPDHRQGFQHHPGWGQVHEMVPGNPDLTELYRRKLDDRYMVQQEVAVADDSPRYYYRPAPMPRMPPPPLPLQKHRLPVASGAHVVQPQQVPAPIPQQRAPPYYSPPDEDHGGPPANMYEPAYMYQQPHPTALVHSPLTSVVRRGPPGQVATEATTQAANVGRAGRTTKPVVSVRTPRYFRPQPDNICKKPSTLCMPLGSQPDPGANKPPPRIRHSLAMKQHSIQQYQHHQQRLQQQHQYHQEYQQHHLHQPLPPNEARGHQDPTQQIPETPRSAPATFNVNSNPLQQQERLKQIQNLMLERREEQSGENRGKGDHIRNCEENVSNIGDDEEKSPNFDLLLSDYQQMFNEDMRAPKTKSKSSLLSRSKHKRSTPRIPATQLLQPRLPPSLKPKKKHGSKSSVKSSQIIQESENAEDNRIEIEQMTTDVLDSLLQDLSINGLTNTDAKDSTHEAINNSNQTSNRSTVNSAKQAIKNHPTENSRIHRKNSAKNLHNVHESHRTNESPRTFNSPKFDDTPTNTTFLQDKARYNQYEEDSRTSFPQDKLIDPAELSYHRETMKRNNYGHEDKLKQSNFKLEVNIGGKNATKKSPWTTTNFELNTPKIDESSATELHRSKSYIVNLIDRALSRELGTIPEEKPQKQYMNLDARAALDLMSSPAAKNMDNDLCMEITHALAESLTATMNQPGGSSNQPSNSGTHVSPEGYRSESNKKEDLIYSTGAEEPVYIKQLKKLRWGHLKHIQREMRRLEDLERFLDSCGTDK